MPESLLARRLKLGKFLGIGLYVHWSFGLLVLYVALSTRTEGLAVMVLSISQLLGVFLCVTLHEYGHALAARAFGIGTADITLLPIGGVARLQRMPRIPWQELIVAVAGPAVNVVIASVLLIVFLLLDRSLVSLLASALSGDSSSMTVVEAIVATMNDLFTSPNIAGFALLMLIVNIMLVLFNMIPAFPMDGGRVFRSLMAMVLDYRKATWVASRVGLGCALLMGIASLGLDPTNPIPVLIALFIGYAGISEARHVDVMESVRGLTVGQVMIRSNLALPMDMPLSEIVRLWRGVSSPAMPVISLVGTVVGMLSLREIANAVQDGVEPSTMAGQLIDHGTALRPVRSADSLESVLVRFGKQQRQIAVVDDSGFPIGVLDLDSMLIRRGLLSHQDAIVDQLDEPRFDVMT